MALKEMLENHPTLLVLGFLAAGFTGGVGAMSYLDEREDKLRQRIIEELKADNEKLKSSRDELDVAVKELVVKHIEQQAALNGRPLGGDNSEVKRIEGAVNNVPAGDIAKIVRDPSRQICTVFGGC